MAHWSEEKEKGGGYWQLKLLRGVYGFLGPGFLRLCLRPIVAVFWLVSPVTRQTSRHFLARVERQAAQAETAAPTVAAEAPLDRPTGREDAISRQLMSLLSKNDLPVAGSPAGAGPYRYRHGDVYRHLYSFACSLIDKLAAWANDLNLDNVEVATDGVADLVNTLNAGSGAVILCSHLGNMEVMRALAKLEVTKVLRNFTLNAIVDFSGSANFNRMLEEANPESMVRLVPANDMGPDTVILLQDRIAAGEVVSIAGDRTAANNRGKTEAVSFLGEPAWFPQGPFVLASLLDAPVFVMFGVRSDDRDPRSRYAIHVHRVTMDLAGGRRERMKKIQKLSAEFVAQLEGLCIRHPFQWYNFFDFWTDPALAAPSMGDE